MADSKQDDPAVEQQAPEPGHVRTYPVVQPDGSNRHQLVLVTSVTEEGRVRGVPVGWADQQAEFAPGMLE